MGNSDEVGFKFPCYGIVEFILIINNLWLFGAFQEERELSILGLEKIVMAFRNKTGRCLTESIGTE